MPPHEPKPGAGDTGPRGVRIADGGYGSPITLQCMLVDKIRVGKRHRSHGDEAPGNDAARRGSETFTLEQRYIASFSRFDDGRVAEIFLQDHKPGSQSDSNARDSTIAASLALQYGCPLDVLRRALLRDAIGTA